MIPEQLQNPEFRFCLVNKWDAKNKDGKELGKAPFEQKWQEKGYKFDDPKLLQHIKDGGNYGVIGGYGKLRILDIDDKNKVEEFTEMFTSTLTVKTGSGGLHIYFTSDYDTPHILKDEMGEYRAARMQCVGPGSRHPSGNYYEVINDKKLINYTKEGIKTCLSQYLKDEDGTSSPDGTNKTDVSPSGKELAEVIRLVKKKKTKEQIWDEMKAFKRWLEKPEAYRERTYKKALELAAKDKEKKEKKEGVLTSGYTNKKQQIIVEQVWDTENGSRFCWYDDNTGKISYHKNFKVGKVNYYPQTGEEIEKGAILLPTKAEEYIDDATLDKKILTFVHKWLDVPKEIEQFGLWNTKRSWVYQQFHTINYLRALGDTGVGKSRFISAFGYIHYKPIFTTGSTTPAPLFRIIEKWKGTVVMDEADFKQSDESEQIIKIINQGFEKGSFIMRCDQNDANQINFFDPYCPKILATRRTYTDKATESRCVTHVCEVTDRKDIPLNLNDEFFEEAQTLRNMLLMWRFKNYFKIDKKIEYDLGEIEPRVKQIVSSYISLFSSDKKQMENFKNYITNYQQELIEERQSSFDGAIVGAIHSFLEEGEVNITAKDIIKKGEFTNHRTGKTMSPRSLTSPLKSLGFKKGIANRVDGKVKKVIPLEEKHLKKLFTRYGFDCNCVTVVTVVSVESHKQDNKGNVTLTSPNCDKTVTVEGSPHRTVTTVTQLQDNNEEWSEEDKKRLELANKKQEGGKING